MNDDDKEIAIKATELIVKLASLIEEYGDLPVGRADSDWGIVPVTHVAIADDEVYIS